MGNTVSLGAAKADFSQLSRGIRHLPVIVMVIVLVVIRTRYLDDPHMTTGSDMP